jgi:hypothetical protein
MSGSGLDPSTMNYKDYMLYRDFEEFKQFRFASERQITMDSSATLASKLTNLTTSTTMQNFLSQTPIAVIQAQDQLNKKLIDNINNQFTDGSDVDIWGQVIKYPNTYTYSLDSSGTQTLEVPALAFINTPSFAFTTFGYTVALEDRGFDIDSQLRVSPTISSSKFTTYNISVNLLDKGIPPGLALLQNLMVNLVAPTVVAPTSGAKGVNMTAIPGMTFDTTSRKLG